MPDGITEPDQIFADLDQWCLRHLDEHSGTRKNARHNGIEDRMVSANLPKYWQTTRPPGEGPFVAGTISSSIPSGVRSNAYLTDRGLDPPRVPGSTTRDGLGRNCHAN